MLQIEGRSGLCSFAQWELSRIPPQYVMIVGPRVKRIDGRCIKTVLKIDLFSLVRVTNDLMFAGRYLCCDGSILVDGSGSSTSGRGLLS